MSLTPDPRFRLRDFATEDARYHDGARGFFVMYVGSSFDRLRAVLMDSELRVYGAWRGHDADGRTCAAHIAEADGHAAVLFEELAGTLDAPMDTYMLFHAPLDRIGGALDPTLTLDAETVGRGNVVDWISTSSTTIAMRAAPRATVIVADTSGRFVVRGGPRSGMAIEPRVAGTEVLYESWYEAHGDESRLAHASLEVDQHPVYYLPERILTGFDTDGRDMTWLHVVERAATGTFLASELWTAPFTTSSLDVRPRQVGPRLEHAPAGTVNEGLFAYVFNDATRFQTHACVIDLEDGSRRCYHLPFEPRRWFGDSGPMWVTREEIALAAHPEREDQTILRIQLSAMTVE